MKYTKLHEGDVFCKPNDTRLLCINKSNNKGEFEFFFLYNFDDEFVVPKDCSIVSEESLLKYINKNGYISSGKEIDYEVH